MSVQILRGTPATLSVTYEQDGVIADPGVVSVSVGRADGTVVAAGDAGGSGEAARTFALTALQTALLDRLTVTWTSATLGTVETAAEIVGALLFTIAEARAFDEDALANATRYSSAEIEEGRTRITDEFERICGVSFIPRLAVETLSGANPLFLPHMRVRSVRSVETRSGSSWTAYSADDVAGVLVDSWGELNRESGSFAGGRRNVRVLYEHGWDRPPLEISRAALTVLRYTLVPDNMSSRTLSVSGEFGTTQFSTPNAERGRHYGIPYVDATLERYRERGPVIA